MRDANFDKIVVGEISVDLLTASPKLSAKAAFVNTKTGSTHGWTTGTQWSAETVEKLRELRALMERDLESVHFADDVGQPTTTTGSGHIKKELQGLGETLGSPQDEVPQG